MMRGAVVLSLIFVVCAVTYGGTGIAISERTITESGQLNTAWHPIENESNPGFQNYLSQRDNSQNDEDENEDAESDDEDENEDAESDDEDKDDNGESDDEDKDDNGESDDEDKNEESEVENEREEGDEGDDKSPTNDADSPDKTEDKEDTNDQEKEDDQNNNHTNDETTATLTPTPTATLTPTPTATLTPTPTATPTPTPAEAKFNISVATLSDTSITAGESVQIAVLIKNIGDRESTFEADLTVDAKTVASESVTIAGGENESVVFEYRIDEPGEYDIAVSNMSLGSLTVTAVTDDATAVTRYSDVTPEASAIEVTKAIAPPDWVREGHEVTVRATVLNTADRTANRTLTVTVDDQPVATKSVTLQPNTRNVVTIGFEAVGGTVAVEGVSAGKVVVGETDGGDRTATDDAAEDDGSGFMLFLALLVTAASVFTGVATLWYEGVDHTA